MNTIKTIIFIWITKNFISIYDKENIKGDIS